MEFRRRRYGLHSLERPTTSTAGLFDRHIGVDGFGFHQILARLDDLGRVGRHFGLGFGRRLMSKGTAANFGGDGPRKE